MYKQISKLSIASMILSFLIIIPFFSGFAAIILGVVSLYIIGAHKEKLRGRGFAITGIFLGLFQLTLIVVVLLTGLVYTWHTTRDDLTKKIRKAKIEARNNNYDKFMYYYKKALGKAYQSPKGVFSAEKFRLYNNMAIELHNMGKHQEAIQAYQSALTSSKKGEAMSYYGIGSVYISLKEYDKAISKFDRAIELNPGMYDAYQNKAATYRLMGEYEKSLAACKTTISLFPEVAKSYVTKGWAYEKLGKHKEAVNLYLEGVKRNPAWQFPRSKISNSFYHLTETEKADVIEKLDKIDSSSTRRRK